MPDTHAPVTFECEIWPNDARDAAETAHARCREFYGDRPYVITRLEIDAIMQMSGAVVGYRGHVEAADLT